MDKIITSYTSCKCCEQDTIMRIVAGNDFTLRISLTYHDDEGNLQYYDLSQATDIVFNAISPDGNRTNFDAVIDSISRIVVEIDAQQLDAYTSYDIEVMWKENNLDRRAAAPKLFTFVNTSHEANDSQETIVDGPYDYNLEIKSDIAYVTIGEIPEIDLSYYPTYDDLDEILISYITYTDLDNTLASYVTNSQLDNTLASYATIAYVTDAIEHINPDLSNYYTKSEIDTQNLSYAYTSAKLPLWKTSSLGIGSWSQVHEIKNNAGTTLFELETPSAVISNNGTAENPDYKSNALSGLITSTDLIQVYKNRDAINNLSSDLTTYYYNKTDIDTTLSSYATKTYVTNAITNVQVDLTGYATYDGISELGYVTQTSLDTTLSSYATISYVENAISNVQVDLTGYATYDGISELGYVTQSSLDTTLQSYATISYVETALSNVQVDLTGYATYDGIAALGYITCDDANTIELLTQTEFDTLQNNNQLDEDTFYYITDSTTNYVTSSDLDDYATKAYVTNAISSVQPDTSNLVTLTTTQTISGTKKFTAENTFTAQNSFNYGTQLQYKDNLYMLFKSSLFSRGSFNQACIGEVLLPNQNVSSTSWSMQNTSGSLPFYTVSNANLTTMTKTQVAKIDSTGIYEGTTKLADKYVQSTNVRNILQISQNDYDTLVNNNTVDANTLYIIT